MSIAVGRFTFEGPFVDTGHLQNKSGIYVVHCLNGGRYFLVDVGESATVRDRVETHDRKSCWSRHCSGTLTVAALYTPRLRESGRREVEQEIRYQFHPPCGDR